MPVAVADGDQSRILGTVHARFDLTHHNPDGHPYAWISNLTIDPAWRGKGLGRALLAAGVANLQQRGACSVALVSLLLRLGNPAAAVLPWGLALSVATIAIVAVTGYTGGELA